MEYRGIRGSPLPNPAPIRTSSAGPAALGPFDITIPWSALDSVLEPGLSGVLAS
ncbi:hypothetical protein AB0L82_09575 [Nocardia sp. NPDC052001]|uniref:hypothetical protein n=1 Tax=Nocardia sp. NPDC052001 TaxID=3154853 RepID=UPI00344AE5A1